MTFPSKDALPRTSGTLTLIVNPHSSTLEIPLIGNGGIKGDVVGKKYFPVEAGLCRGGDDSAPFIKGN